MIEKETAKFFIKKEVIITLENDKTLVGTIETIGENSLLLVHPDFGPNAISYEEISQIRLRETNFRRGVDR